MASFLNQGFTETSCTSIRMVNCKGNTVDPWLYLKTAQRAECWDKSWPASQADMQNRAVKKPPCIVMRTSSYECLGMSAETSGWTPSKQGLSIALFRLTHLIHRPFSWDFDQRARCLSSASLNLKVPGVAQEWLWNSSEGEISANRFRNETYIHPYTSYIHPPWSSAKGLDPNIL